MKSLRDLQSSSVKTRHTNVMEYNKHCFRYLILFLIFSLAVECATSSSILTATSAPVLEGQPAIQESKKRKMKCLTCGHYKAYGAFLVCIMGKLKLVLCLRRTEECLLIRITDAILLIAREVPYTFTSALTLVTQKGIESSRFSLNLSTFPLIKSTFVQNR
jgi:hypothetical protein